MRPAGFVAVELALLALAQFLGGPPWTAVAAVACGCHVAGPLQPTTLLPLAPALVWAVAAGMSGNRELFFPFAMHLAAAAALSRGSTRAQVAAGGAVAATFLAIRWLQAATPRVLAIELAAVVVVLGVAIALARRLPATTARGWMPIAAALLACACLAI
ncbi:MAG: hypothetical protein ACKO4T_08570 [Planctomycetaceae bacterium]